MTTRCLIGVAGSTTARERLGRMDCEELERADVAVAASAAAAIAAAAKTPNQMRLRAMCVAPFAIVGKKQGECFETPAWGGFKLCNQRVTEGLRRYGTTATDAEDDAAGLFG